MKIVHLATNDEGGAYQAAVRISSSMEMLGADSYVVLRNKNIKTNAGYESCTGIKRFLSKICNFLNLILSFGDVQSDFFGMDITGEDRVTQADVIVLHWTNSFISYRAMKKIHDMGKPVLWVMHDMWLMTGGCHCDKNCGGYEDRCTHCPEAANGFQRNIAGRNFSIKDDMIHLMKPLVITPSRWLGELTGKSDIFKGIGSYVINNPLDLEIFRPYSDRENTEVREKYGISGSEHLIIFSAFNALRNENKGFAYLREALAGIDKDGYTLLVCGSEKDDTIQEIGMVKVKYAGYIEDLKLIARLYSSADVLVSPSKQENYSGVALEALACGTPVTAFAIGGTPEIIDHMETGFLADFEDTDQLREGILYCCMNKDKMTGRAREVRVNTNSPEKIGEQYLEIIRKELP